MRKKIDWGILGLLGILGVIWVTNFTPGTWLAGWDNLMPELNIWLNLKRSLLAVWQEYQGLGLVGGMGHATDLIRQLILLPFILALPHHLIRYFWHFSMLGLGTLGMYWGLGKFEKKERFLAALFYLLNFGTIQIFWPPYEAFSTFWGFFPWLVFLLWQVLEKPSRKNWRLLILINILAIPSFYIQTLFLIYLGVLGILGLAAILGSLKKLAAFLRSLGLILLINAFWLLPFAYFLATNLQNPRLGISNQIASGETFLRNQRRGTPADFLLLRGYYYDFFDNQQPLMAPWQKHFSQNWALALGYFLGSLAVLGALAVLGRAVKKKASPFEWGILGIFLLAATALLSATPPFSWLNWLFRQSPLVNQIFRSPFTKFVYPAAFSAAFLFAIGAGELLPLLGRIRKRADWLARGAIVAALIAFAGPVFQGNFFNPAMRVKIPNDYFQLIQFFKTQPPQARIANLPQGNFWGWKFYRWGYRGSGFLWYGLEQPILDRAFDVWNLKNEQYYWELNKALQGQDQAALNQVLKKYFVRYVIFDNRLIFPGKAYAKQALKTRQLLGRDRQLRLIRQFGQISVYLTEFATRPALVKAQTVFAPPLLESDSAFARQGDYRQSSTPNFLYPAEFLFSRHSLRPRFRVQDQANKWQIGIPFPFSLDSYRIAAKSAASRPLPLYPTFANLPSGLRPLKTVIIRPQDLIEPHQCAPAQPDGWIKFRRQGEAAVLRAYAAALCVNWKNYDFFQQFRQPLIVKVEFEYQSQKDEWPRFCLWDNKHHRCLNHKDAPFQGFAPHWQKYQETVLVNPQKQPVANLAFILDAYRQKRVRQISYRRIKLSVYSARNVNLPQTVAWTTKISRDGSRLVIDIPKAVSPYFIPNVISRRLYQLQPRQCNPTLPGKLVTIQAKGNYLRLEAQEADSCISWYFPNLPLNLGWLVRIKTRHRQGYPLIFSATGGNGRYPLLYAKLKPAQDWQEQFFVIPAVSRDPFAKGLGISFNSNSFSRQMSSNDIAALEIAPLNWDYLAGLELAREKDREPSPRRYLTARGHYWHYRLKLAAPIGWDETLVLPQSYSPGWLAVYFQGWRPHFLGCHVLVDNWANGWEIPDSSTIHHPPSTIHILFWPQILEWLGLGLLVGVIIVSVNPRG